MLKDKILSAFEKYRLPVLAAWLGVVVYAWRAFDFARFARSNLDEGLYLFKGYLFATGVYTPFAPYQVWTNKGPLAFLIPGYVQTVFGPGLLTGRYFSIFLGVLMLLGTWAAARRLGNSRLAAAAVWALALGQGIGIYSLVNSQVLVAVMFAWMLAFSLGSGRPLWQLILSGLLAGLMILTRQNMILVLPILALYILWEHGRKAALYSLLSGTIVLILGHALYWPDILQLWIPWLPRALTPFLDTFRLAASAVPRYSPDLDLQTRLLAVAQGLRGHVFALGGSLLVLFLWPRRPAWKTDSLFKAAVFLGVLFAVLLALHFWASILHDYCVFCFGPYLAFFNIAGILFVLAVLGTTRTLPGPPVRIAIALLGIVLFAMIAYSVFEDLGDPLLSTAVPLFKDGSFRFNTIWNILEGKFALSRNLAKQYVSAGFGLLVGLVVAGSAFVLRKRSDFGIVLTNLCLIGGLLFSLSLGVVSQPCGIDVIHAFEEDGAYLARIVPPGALVYWDGPSLALLAYIPGVKIFPAQLNQGAAFFLGGDPQELLRFGRWNQEIKEQWIEQAEFFIVEESKYPDWDGFFSSERFDEYPRAPQAVACYDGARVRIFRKKP